MLKIFLLSIFALQMRSAQKFFTILVLTDENQNHVLGTIGAALKAAEETYPGFRFDQQHVASVEESEDDSYREIQRAVGAGAGAVLDLTRVGWTAARTASRRCRLPYLRADAARTVHAAVAAYLDRRRATDAVFVTRRLAGLEGATRFFIGKHNLRLGIVNALGRNVAKALLQLSPIPEYFVLYGSTGDLATLYEQAEATKLTELAERWLLVFEDFDHGSFNRSLRRGTAVMTADKDVCCRLVGKAAGCRCDNNTQPTQEFLRHVVLLLARLANHLDELGAVATPRPENCTSQADGQDEDRDASSEHVTQALKELADDGVVGFDPQDDVLYLRSDLHVWTAGNTRWSPWGRYRDDQLVAGPGAVSQPARRFFRVGVVESIPWSYKRKDAAAGNPGRPCWEGYCVDLLQELADGLRFDYELVEPRGGGLGVRRPDGSWDGVVGDMVAGKTDIIIAPLPATSEREEVLDFVAPYFYKSGISIVIRKPVHKASLFKFMKAMKLEVWLSILASLALTAVMIWLLDKFSPYSYRNNKRMYPHPCRMTPRE